MLAVAQVIKMATTKSTIVGFKHLFVQKPVYFLIRFVFLELA